jgi:hypothetical protein
LIFKVFEPAMSAWAAGQAFYLVARTPPIVHAGSISHAPVIATIAMTAAYFLSNTVLTALAVGIESGVNPFDVWRQNALHLAINYQAAGSLAALAIGNGGIINLQAVALIIPLLLLSYVAYQSASARLQQAHEHGREVEQLYESTVETLAIAVDAKDQVTHGHIRRVQRHTVALAKVLGIIDARDLKALERRRCCTTSGSSRSLIICSINRAH